MRGLQGQHALVGAQSQLRFAHGFCVLCLGDKRVEPGVLCFDYTQSSGNGISTLAWHLQFPCEGQRLARCFEAVSLQACLGLVQCCRRHACQACTCFHAIRIQCLRRFEALPGAAAIGSTQMPRKQGGLPFA